MIVKLHDGTVGELVGTIRWEQLSWHPQIVVARGDDVLAVLWDGEPAHEGRGIAYARDASIALQRAVALAGLCFWPDPNGCDLDLSPWVRDRVMSERRDAAVAARENCARHLERVKAGFVHGNGDWIRQEAYQFAANSLRHMGAVELGRDD